jgi:hypothetical protein
MKTTASYLNLKNLDFDSNLAWYSRQLGQFASHVARHLGHESHDGTEEFQTLLRQAHAIYGVRCRAFEILAARTHRISATQLKSDVARLCEIVALIAGDHSSETVVRLAELLADCAAEYPNLEKNFVLTWSREWESGSVQDSVFWMSYSHLAHRAWVHLDSEKLSEFVRARSKPVAEPKSAPALTESQQAAVTQLKALYRAKRAGLTAGGITPSLNPLVYGSSGSGKSFVVRTLAAELGLPLFETTMSSWLPQGSRAKVPTARRLAHFLNNEASDGAILFIDELEKLRPNEKASEYSRCLLDEVMGVLSSITDRWEGWSEETTEILRSKVFIVAAGTFQELYKGAQAEDQTWQETTIADRIWDQQYLPEELLMRLSSSMIEIQAPGLAEVTARIEAIHKDMEIALPSPQQVIGTAENILRGRCNMRGLQSYMTELWLRTYGRSEEPKQTLGEPQRCDSKPLLSSRIRRFNVFGQKAA